MSGLIEYKCPNCNGTVEFDSSIQEMKCPFCDTTFAVASLMELDKELEHAPSDQMDWSNKEREYMSEDETAGLNVYSCQSCGGEVVADETTAATSCPFCDNNIVLKDRFAGDLKPDYVIPFAFDKKAAKAALKKHVDKRFVPKIFKDENHIDEIKGVYVPVWLFDSDVEADMVFKGELIRFYSDSRYNYTETSVYRLNRSGTLSFRSVPVDGSTKMDDDLMESVEPFDLSGQKDFQTAYLAGYLANRYDVDVDESIHRANERLKHSTAEMFSRSVAQYSNVTVQYNQVHLSNNSYAYALYPVWLLNTSWNGKKYQFAMNGQTGKFVGNLPLDKGAYSRWFVSIAAITSVVVYAIAWMFR